MKKFRNIYYICIAAVAVILFVVSILSTNFSSGSNSLNYDALYSHITKLTEIGARNYTISDELNNTIDYITDFLEDSGINRSPYESTSLNYEDDYSKVEYVNNQPTFVLQKVLVNQDTNNVMQDNGVYIDKVMNNIIVAFPSKVTVNNGLSDAVVFHTSYDTDSNKSGAMSANADVAVMLETIKALKAEGNNSANDIVFVFSENYQSNLGLYVYINQFDGFGAVSNRTKLAIGMFSYGTTGAMSIYETSDDDFGMLSKLLIGGGSSSLVSQLYDSSDLVYNKDWFSFNYANYGNFGDSYYVNSPTDDLSGVNKSAVMSKADLLNGSIRKFRDIDLNSLNSDTSGAYFSYLGIGVTIPVVAIIVLGILILMLAILAVIMLVRNKHTTGLRIRNSFVVSLLALAGVFIGIIALYYFVGFFFLVGFGVIPVALLNSFSFYNTGMLVVLFIISFAIYNAFINPLKKMFNISSSDVARANVFILALLAAVLAFVVPTFAYAFVILSFLQTIAIVVIGFVKNKFRDKYKYDIERLLLYFIPTVLSFPIILPVLIGTASVIAMPLYALLGVAIALMFSGLFVYFGMLIPRIDRLLYKLPKYNVKVVKDEILEVESSVKKGRLVKEKVRSVETRKYNFRYHNYILTSLLVIICIIVMSVSAIPASAYGVSIDTLSYQSIYNNGMVLVHETDASGTVRIKWEIKDKNTYKFVNNVVDGFKYSSDTDSYTLGVNSARSGFSPTSKSTDGNKTTYTLWEASSSQVEIYATGASNITSFKFSIGSSGDTVVYEYENVNELSEIAFELPYNFANNKSFTVEAVGGGSVSYELTQYCYETHELGNYQEWNDVVSYLRDKGLSNRLSGGIIFRI